MSDIDRHEADAAAGSNVLTDQQRLETVLDIAEAITHATDAYSGEVGRSPFDVFPDPQAPGVHSRADVKVKAGQPADESAFRLAMLELGAGRHEDLDATQAGLNEGYLALIEGGTWAKMFAELTMVRFNSISTGAVVIAASQEKEVKQTEREEMARQLKMPLSAVGKTEYEIACQVAARMPGFQPAKGKIPYSYDINGNIIEGVDVADSPFTCIGTYDKEHVPVYVMDVIRQYTDESHTRYAQIDDYAKVRLLTQMWQWQGGKEVALVTSHLYPSRKIGAMRAARALPGMRIQVLSYGAESIANARGLQVSQPTVDQLAGEAFSVARHVADFHAELTAA